MDRVTNAERIIWENKNKNIKKMTCTKHNKCGQWLSHLEGYIL